MAVKDGQKEWVTLAYEQPFSYITFRGENPEDIRSELVLDNHLMPPFEAVQGSDGLCIIWMGRR